MQESAQKFRSVSANALDGVIMIDSRPEVIFWNTAAEKLFGYGVEEALGRNALDLITPPRYR